MCKSLLILSIPFMLISFAETPVFDDPVYIEANGIPINVGYGGNASSFIIDWDGDGKQDLLLGQFNLGRVRFYTNTGTNYNPTFGDFVYLQADGIPISVSYGWCQGATVAVYDLNDDSYDGTDHAARRLTSGVNFVILTTGTDIRTENVLIIR